MLDVQPTYVATVPGLHPYGFYVATVPYRALPLLQADGRVMRLDSLEQAAHPQNDLAAVQTHVDAIHAGQGVGPFNGAGVKVAVADSGFDLTHPDIPTPVEASGGR